MTTTRAAWYPLLALLAAGCSSSPKPAETANAAAPVATVPAGQVEFPAGSPKLAQIQVVAVSNGQVPADEVTSPGKVEANPNRTSHVALPVPGRVMNVFVKIGDYVRQGQPLLQVESPDVDTALSNHLQALASVTQSKSALVKAQADLDRVRDLFAHNAVAQKEVLNAEAVLTQNKAAVDQAEATVQQAKRRLEILGVEPGRFGQLVTVNAPISGKVLEMAIVTGEYRNDVSQTLMTIADLSTVWIAADVQESSIRLIQVGELTQIELAAYPGEVFKGRVKQIADMVDPQTRTVKVRIEMNNKDGRLRPEMFGRIRHASGMESRPLIPSSAVVEGEGQQVVWREIGAGRFEKTHVTLGSRLADKVAVLQGVKDGDRVVADGVMLLQSR